MKDIAVSPYEGTIRLDTLRLRFCFLNLHKTAESIGNVVGKPCAAECRMGSQPPYSKLSHIQLHTCAHTLPVLTPAQKTMSGKGASLAQWGCCTDGLLDWAGWPVWERYSGLVLFGLEFALFGFFSFNLHFLRRPFSDAGYYSKKTKKAVLPEIGEQL